MDMPEPDRRKVMLASFLLAGLIAGSIITYLGMNTDTLPKQQVGENTVSLLERTSGQQLELVNVEEVSGLYRVNVKNRNDRLSTYYVSRDGELLAPSVTDMNRLRDVIESRQQFSECLQEKNVKLYGNASQQATRLQIQRLGGASVVNPVYRDVSDRENLQEAVEKGIRRVPAIYYNGSVLQGVNRLGRVEEFTGCAYSPPAP